MSPTAADPLRITFAHPVPAELSDELRRRIFFICDDIERFELTSGERGIDGMTVYVATRGTSLDALRDKVQRVVTNEILKQKKVPAKRIWSAPETDRQAADLFPEMVRRGIAFECGEGQVALGEPALSLMDHLDVRLREIALGLPAAREYRYPTLIPTEALEQSGYLRSFPHFIMFVTRLHNDIDSYERFLSDYASAGTLPATLFAGCHHPDYCLPPTMCYHTFHQFRNRRATENIVVTSRGKSFRFESKYHEGLARLWDFTIRETVFIGSRAFVLEMRDRFMAEIFALLTELGLDGYCDTANDHFFANSDAAERISTQLLMELKYEVRLHTGGGRTVAVGSFNFHDLFFAKSFNIHAARDEQVVSGCTGFGLERLAYSFLCQHGLDLARWPALRPCW
jgi:hypothetical protein